MFFTFSISMFAFLTRFAIKNLYWRKLLSMIWWSTDQLPRDSNFRYTESANDFNFALKSPLTRFDPWSSYVKKINFTSSSNWIFTLGKSFLIRLSSTINFSTKSERVSSILTDLSLSVGTVTTRSFSTIFSTIFSLGTWNILG